MDVMNLVAKLSLDDSQYQSKLSSVKNGASSVGSSISSSFSKAGNGFKSLGGKITGFGTKIQSMGTGVTNLGKRFAPLSLAAGAVFLPAVKGAMSFEDKVAKVSTLVDTTKTPVDKLKNTFMKLSNETGIAAEELAEAGYQALSASVPVEKLGSFTKTAANLAKAGFTTTATSVDVLTTALNAYGEKAGTAEQIANKLVKTQNLGKTTVDELARNMGKVIPVASATGVGINQLTTSYAVLTKQGINTRIATTQIKSLIDELGKSGSKSSELLKNKTGKSFKDLMGDGKSLGTVLLMLDEAAKKEGKSLKDMFSSSQAGSAAIALLVNGGKDYDDVLSQMEKDTNDVDVALKKLGSTSGAKIRKSLTLLKNAGIALGDAFLKAAAPAITKVAKFVQNLSVKFQNLDPKIKTTIAVVLGIVTALAPVLIIVGKVIAVIGLIVKGVGAVVSALGLLFTPVGLVVAAIAAVIAIGVALYKNWDKVKAAAIALLGKLKVSFNQIRQAIINAWNAVRRATVNAWNSVKNTILNTWKNIKSAVSTAINAVKTTVSTVFGDVKTTVSTIWDAIKTTVSKAVDAVKTTVSNVFNAVKTTVTNVWNGIKTSISKAINTARDAVKNAVKKVNTFLSFKGLSKIVSGVFTAVKTAINNPIRTAKSVIESAHKTITKLMQFKGLTGVVTRVFVAIGKVMFNPIGAAKDAIEGAVKTIKKILSAKIKVFSNIKVPYFKISGGTPPWGIGGLGKKPNIDIGWKRKGMNNLLALDGATIFGAMSGKFLGGGEAGRELVVGEKYALNMIRKASNNENVEVLLVQLIGLLERWLPYKTVAYINRNDISQTVNRELGKMMI